MDKGGLGSGGFDMRTDVCQAPGMFFLFFFFTLLTIIYILQYRESTHHQQHQHHHHIMTMTATGPPLTSTITSTGPETFLRPCFSVFFFFFFTATNLPLQAQDPRHVSGPFFFFFTTTGEYRPEMRLGFFFSFF